ncbi:stress responsive alpha/beta barrel protein [Prosthecobacter fusiformis]|uniref:Stress responsive alpha/beta barrel protein n=1 Tax=Prosthecobacter fusiformis TaxID=48464 RepID=A0A4R7RLZ6_9BACT|nr:Dabb family protein [Prosthecobacter fusiformis]TDU63184.1 stress responsive alpha/beta barrel protein [Prosthecobacter fusiformis]
MIHNVYFWLKKDLSTEQVEIFENELIALKTIEYLEHGFVGKPAPTEERPVTDHSFSYSLVLHFKNMEDHEFYQKDCPKHKRFVDICKPFFERVIVYDTSPIH